MTNPNFIDLCETFEAISTKKGKQPKLLTLRTFVNHCERGLKFYDALRLFLPHWERERGPYRLGEQTFTKTLANILCLPPTGSDINLLKNYNQSATGVAAKFKDYADAAYSVVRKRTRTKSNHTYSVTDINAKLNSIAAESIRKQETIIYDLFKTLSHLEIKWLIRILLREMKLGLGKSDILQCYHPDGDKYFTTNNSLKQLCLDLEDRRKTASDIEVTLFNAFRPMLSLRCDVKEFNKSVKDCVEFYVEEKFDGERFQVHFGNNGNKCKYFSRNGYDFTPEFKVHSEAIRGCLNAESVILDGEMMIYNKVTKKFGSKGMYADIKKVKPDSNIQQCFCIFDLVYLNGKNLSNTSLKERKLKLEQVVTPMEGIIMISSWKIVNSRQGIVDELNSSMDKKLEGIVFKVPMGRYLPNERVGWWKVKLEYFEGVMSDLDVLIIGGYYGQGANKGEIAGYLVAVKDRGRDRDTKGRSKRFLSFAKISTGLTRAETKTLNKELDPFWRDVQAGDNHEQEGVIWGKEKPDKWIKPSNSKCLLVRGSELIKLYDSSSIKDYATQYTLRFPRILGLRLDKLYEDCLTTDDLTNLTGGSRTVEKLNKRHLELNDLMQTEAAPKRKKVEWSFTRLPVDVISDILAPHVFVVLSGKGDWRKDAVEKAIRENGGTVALETTTNTLCMLVGDEHLRTSIYQGDVDIVQVEWLRKILNEGEFDMYDPFEVVYMSEKSRRKFMQEFDKFGDAYVQAADKKSLKKVFDIFAKSNNHMNPTVDEINEFHAEIGFNRECEEWKLLRGYVAYFDRHKIINDPLSRELHRLEFLDRIEFKAAGGTVSEFLTAECDCVIAARERFEEVQVYLQSFRRDIPIYSSTEEFKQHVLVAASANASKTRNLITEIM